MFTGILLLILFSAALYADQGSGSVGEKIFSWTTSALTPLGAAIIGYFFGLQRK